MKKAPKLRPVNFELIAEKIDGKRSEPYRIFDEMMKYHSDIEQAKIALAWQKKLKHDVDGHMRLGCCVKLSAREKAVHPETRYDFVILLNREIWMDIAFTPEKKRALIDHELCHAAPVLSKTELEPQYDEHGHALYRTRKHDIEEFRCIVERHGCYKRDLEQFAEALLKKRKTPLLNVLDEVAGEINKGAFDKDGVKVTATVTH